MVDRGRVVARRRWTGADMRKGEAYEGRDWFKAAYFIGMFLVLGVLGVMVYWKG